MSKLSFASLKRGLKSRLSVPGIRNNAPAMAAWEQTHQAQHLFSLQKDAMSELLMPTSGHTALFLSPFEDVGLDQCCRYPLRMRARLPGTESTADLAADAAFLPYESNSLNLVVLHHVLDFSARPKAVLKEVGRVVRSQGHILIVGFNPVSLGGLTKLVKQLAGASGISRRNNLRVGRLEDWCQFLDFNPIQLRYVGHLPLIGNKRYLQSAHKYDSKLSREWLPFSRSYCMLVRKDEIPLTPLKTEWNIRSLTQALHLPKVAGVQKTGQPAKVFELKDYIKT
jgi:SAM-dependent methyltransferase